MTIEELKKEVNGDDKLALDVLLSMYRDLFSDLDRGNIAEIGLYLYELELKYGKQFINKFYDTDEYKAVYKDYYDVKKNLD